MPNITKRRKFTVQNGLEDIGKPSSSSTLSVNKYWDKSWEQNLKYELLGPIPLKDVNVDSSSAEKLKEDISSTSTNIFVKFQPTPKLIDREVAASSSNIDFFAPLNDFPVEQPSDDVLSKPRNIPLKPKKYLKIPAHSINKNEKYSYARRVKVRGPKRKALTQVVPVIANVVNVGTSTADLVSEQLPERNASRDSCHSTDPMCRICHGGEAALPDLGLLISACSCRGTVGKVHVKCLERWLTESGKSRCELCGTRYTTRRVHKYGVIKALIMWILSQNAKQLMVDSLGIMLMSPLAVLAAWLSGRTLAGLMTHETEVTPWPLASTFVLACMTLVCYYCWIVSAATRHALSWWMWYRSQYEVKLEFDNENPLP